MTRMRQPGQSGRMFDEKAMLCRMGAALDGYFEGVGSGARKGNAAIIMHGRCATLHVDYGSFTMETNGIGIRKHTDSGWRAPTKSEIRRFKADIAEAAKSDSAIAGFLGQHPALR